MPAEKVSSRISCPSYLFPPLCNRSKPWALAHNSQYLCHMHPDNEASLRHSAGWEGSSRLASPCRGEKSHSRYHPSGSESHCSLGSSKRKQRAGLEGRVGWGRGNQRWKRSSQLFVLSCLQIVPGGVHSTVTIANSAWGPRREKKSAHPIPRKQQEVSRDYQGFT